MPAVNAAALSARYLNDLGLEGDFQVHASGRVNAFDERCHQLFLGQTPALADLLAGRLKAETPCQVLSDEGWIAATLASLPDDWEAVVIPGADQEHPGGLYGLVHIVDRLLGPGGCPWDQEQTHETLKKHLLSEVYELFDAIDLADQAAIQEELGDVLLQPVMHAQMEALSGNWTIDHVAERITRKLIGRHPHVFGDANLETSEQVLAQWDRLKGEEKKGGILAGVSKAQPSLLRASDISVRAARSGFEWPSMGAVLEKLDEERQELQEALDAGIQDEIESELGDLLFTLVNVARWAKVEPEEALRKMADRFTARFESMERAAGKPLQELSPEEWDELWNQAKA